jgi:hypothetical protein
MEAPQEKRSLVLLGAGASREAGIPLTTEMTQHIVETIGGVPSYRTRTGQALIYVCGAMIGHESKSGRSPFEGVDVEKLFSAVQLLADRRELEVAPFISSWDPTVEALDRQPPNPFLGSAVHDALKSDLARGRGRSKLGDEIHKAIAAETGAGTGETYRRLLSEMTLALRQLVAIGSADDAMYLSPLVSLSRMQGGLTIATLNYDLAMELVAAELNEPLATGIAAWSEARQFQWPKQGIKLLKLHGSINWCIEQKSGALGVLPQEILTTTDDPVEDRRQPAVIFGQRGKLRSDGPFLDLLQALDDELALARELIVVGYSFRDDHINEAIRRWINGLATRTLTVIDPGIPEGEWAEGFLGELMVHLGPRELNPDVQYEPRMKIVRMPASQGLLSELQLVA